MSDPEVKRWIKVARPATGTGMVVTVTLLRGNISAKYAVKTSQATLKTETRFCYQQAMVNLTDLTELDALLDQEDA